MGGGLRRTRGGMDAKPFVWGTIPSDPESDTRPANTWQDLFHQRHRQVRTTSRPAPVKSFSR